MTMPIVTPELITQAADRAANDPTGVHLVLLLDLVARTPDSVERCRRYANAQTNDEDHKLFHYMADMLTYLQDPTFALAAWPDYQAPPATAPHRRQTP